MNVVQNSKIKIIVNKAAHDRKQTSFIQLASLQKLNVAPRDAKKDIAYESKNDKILVNKAENPEIQATSIGISGILETMTKGVREELEHCAEG